MDFDAYGQAVVHLAWYRDDKSYHLVFGIVELHPSELPPRTRLFHEELPLSQQGKQISSLSTLRDTSG